MTRKRTILLNVSRDGNNVIVPISTWGLIVERLLLLEQPVEDDDDDPQDAA